MNCEYIETSSKDNVNLMVSFERLYDLILFSDFEKEIKQRIHDKDNSIIINHSQQNYSKNKISNSC